MTRPGSFHVIDGQKDDLKVVCTWCGSKFLKREDLDDHWATDPRCRRNRNVNNQTQTKYNIVEPGDEDA